MTAHNAHSAKAQATTHSLASLFGSYTYTCIPMSRNTPKPPHKERARTSCRVERGL